MIKEIVIPMGSLDKDSDVEKSKRKIMIYRGLAASSADE